MKIKYAEEYSYAGFTAYTSSTAASEK